MDFFLDLLRARPRRRDRHPPLPAGAARRRARAPATSASTSTAPTSRSSSSRAFLLAVIVLLAVAIFAGPPRRRRGALERPSRSAYAARRPSRSCSARCCSRGSLADHGNDVVAGLIAGTLCAAPRLRRRARPVQPRRARASTPRRAQRARRSTPRAPRCCAAGLSVLFPPLALLVLGGLLAAARRRPPARAARSTPACASSDDRGTKPKKLVLAVIDAHEAGDARAGGRRPGRAPALEAADRARRATSTTASRPSRRSRRCARRSIATGVGPGRAPHPVDELVPPRRGALRRVRLELQGVAARSASSARSPTRSTT